MLNEQPVETTVYSLDAQAPESAQRRHSERHLSLFRVGSLIIGDRQELCLIRNVSAGGMLVRVYSKIDEGTEVAIELKQGELLTGTVRWAKDDCIGLTFDKPVDILELISISVDGPRQRLPRVEVHCVAWVREGAVMHRTKAVNVSQGGIRVSSDKPLPIGAEVVVTLPGLTPIPGRLCWSDQDQHGIRFNRALALQSLVEWLRGQQQTSRRRAAS